MTFEWKLPTRVVFGAGRFSSTSKFVRGLGKRAVIVTSRSFEEGGARSGVLADLLANLKRIGVETSVFSEVEPNPTTTTIDRAARLARDDKPRYVIGLGGGSVMDAAKCVAMLAVNDGGAGEYSYQGPGQPMRPFNHALPIVCIPTLAATGSETSLYAVVTDPARRRKTTIFNEALIPTLAIVDPELTYSSDARQTVDGAFDMITHVLESYLSATEPAPLQDRLSEAIVETVVAFLPRALAHPRDELARSQLSFSGTLALSGVLSGREGGWPIHALEHGLSAVTGVGHGRGLALLLPRLMAFDETAIAEKVAQFNTRIFKTPSLKDGLVRYMRDVGAWTRLDELLAPGMDAETVIKATLDHAFEIDAVLKRGEEPYLANVRKLYRQDALNVLRACRSDEI